MPSRPSLSLRSLLALLGVSLLSGCSLLAPPTQARGDRVDSEQLKQLVPGVSSQTDAAALLGSPTAKDTFDQNTWIYVSELTRPVVGGTLAIENQHVVKLRFDDRGVLRDVTTLGRRDALPARIVSRTTPAPGTEASVLQQLFGNIGRFNPGGLGGSPAPPSGGGLTTGPQTP
ncbi:MAG TPA: outer membrane protein assembly factor BamE [Acetobacteraceae bacterium]|nr:outer membrane protein assembly factor BamE [Acetobacteraceae bacterium]